MYIELGIEDQLIEAVSEYLTGGGEFVTYKEHIDLLDRVEDLERRVRDVDFWKADRNHYHKQEGE